MRLNILTVALCLPIVTAGPAMTAMYKQLFDMRLKKETSFQAYFRTFKADFKAAFFLELILLLLLAAFGLCVFLLRGLLVSGNALPWISVVVLGSFVVFPLTYAFPLLSKFDNTVIQTLINAFLMSTRHMGTTLKLLALSSIPFVLFFVQRDWFFISILFWAVFGFALLAWIASGQFIEVFKKYAEL